MASKKMESRFPADPAIEFRQSDVLLKKERKTDGKDYDKRT